MATSSGAGCVASCRWCVLGRQANGLQPFYISAAQLQCVAMRCQVPVRAMREVGG